MQRIEKFVMDVTGFLLLLLSKIIKGKIVGQFEFFQEVADVWEMQCTICWNLHGQYLF